MLARPRTLPKSKCRWALIVASMSLFLGRFQGGGSLCTGELVGVLSPTGL